jgi:tetratricopeptide (TPR) repeat protein
VWIERAVEAAKKASALRRDVPEVLVAEAWILYAEGQYDRAASLVRQVVERRPDTEGAYFLLGRTLFSAGRYQEIADMADSAVAAAGEDYNTFVPIVNALGALGKTETLRNIVQQRIQVLERHIQRVPEDARGRTLLATDYARMGRTDDAVREAQLAMALRPNEATVMYNAACVFCQLGRKPEALQALRKAWEAGFKDADWARRDPDLTLLRGEPEFDELYPASAGEAGR